MSRRAGAFKSLSILNASINQYGLTTGCFFILIKMIRRCPGIRRKAEYASSDNIPCGVCDPAYSHETDAQVQRAFQKLWIRHVGLRSDVYGAVGRYLPSDLH